MKRYFLFLFLLATVTLQAHDFEVTLNGNTLYFNIIGDNSVALTYRGSIDDTLRPSYSGTLTLPERVLHNAISYTVTTVGDKAFSGAEGIDRVVFPKSVGTIGDFAFEGCTRLSSVVFPSGTVAMGQGVFFRCSSLKHLTFGGEWKVLDLTPYRWSDSLTAIQVPAKVERILNMKSLSHLTSVSVDVNNTHFASEEGVLYSKDGKTLYGVPRAYRGTLTIATGTEMVERGALMDCVGIRNIVVPATVQTLSFRETSRMRDLQEVRMLATKPMTTAYDAQGKGCFLLMLANSKAKIVVPVAAKEAYLKALATQPGDYAEQSQGIAYSVENHQAPAVKNIATVK